MTDKINLEELKKVTGGEELDKPIDEGVTVAGGDPKKENNVLGTKQIVGTSK